jgi:hypothetical protein
VGRARIRVRARVEIRVKVRAGFGSERGVIVQTYEEGHSWESSSVPRDDFNSGTTRGSERTSRGCERVGVDARQEEGI